MATKTLVIISVSDRVRELNLLMRTVLQFPKFNDYDVNLLFQDPFGVAGRIENQWRYKNIFVTPEKLGCHWARVELLQRIQYDYYVNLDDDMELMEQTDYEQPIVKAAERSTGFVLTNWARWNKMFEAKIPKMKPVFTRQVMVYQGGGMVYRDEIADLMRALPRLKTHFDHAWPLTAYINGYVNYRYLGSLAIHRVCGSGGMSAFMRDNPAEFIMGDLINIKPSKFAGHYLIPEDKDIKPRAHELHRQNKK